MAEKVIKLFGTGQFTGQKKPSQDIGQFQDKPYGIKLQQPLQILLDITVRITPEEKTGRSKKERNCDSAETGKPIIRIPVKRMGMDGNDKNGRDELGDVKRCQSMSMLKASFQKKTN